MKKLLSILLSILLIILVCPLGLFDFTTSAATSGYYTYSVENNKATITYVDPAIGGYIEIPSILDGYDVTTIGGTAFSDCSCVTRVTIPDSVTHMGSWYVGGYNEAMFSGCNSLSEIIVSEDNNYFCSIDGVLFNKDATQLFKYPTAKANASYVVPDSVKSIYRNAFYCCSNLTSITFPEGLKTLYDSSFNDCASLKIIFWPSSLLDAAVDDPAFVGTNMSITEVWYAGSKEDREEIYFACSVGELPSAFKNTIWHFNTCKNNQHTYDGDCDSDCNNCEWTREVVTEHNYVAKVTNPTCTTQGYTTYTCSLCGDSYIDSYVNVADHSYDNACDANCNICGNIRITLEHVYDDIYDTDCNVCGTTRQLTSISISILPTKIVYAVGEAFDNSGMVVNAYYSDGTSGVITRYTVVDFDSSTAGTKIVNVTYGGRITQFAVTILALEFSGASLTIQNDITINYMVDKTAFDNAGYTNPYVEFEFNGAKTIKRAYSTEDGMYIFRFNNIVPSQINDTVKATLYAEYNGVVYSGKAIEYSVTKYCYTMLNEYAESDNAELKTLLVDLLNYGAAAQIYTDYNTASLANASLTDEQAAWGTETATELNNALNAKYEEIESTTVKWKSVGLNLKDSVSIRFKIAVESYDNLTVKVTSESGQEWTVLGGNFESAGNGCYYVYFENLSAYQMREKIYVTVYDGDTAVSNTLCYSIESYAYAAQSSSDENLKNLLDAMIKYGDSAYNYKQSIG